MGHVRVTLPIFGFFWTSNILGVVKARNFKFGTEIDGSEYLRQKNQN